MNFGSDLNRVLHSAKNTRDFGFICSALTDDAAATTAADDSDIADHADDISRACLTILSARVRHTVQS